MYTFDTHADAKKLGFFLEVLWKLNLNDENHYSYRTEEVVVDKVTPSGWTRYKRVGKINTKGLWMRDEDR